MMPECISAVKSVSYYVPDIVDKLKSINESPDYDPSLHEVIGYIEDWIEEDLEYSNTIIFQDENGNEIWKRVAGRDQ